MYITHLIFKNSTVAPSHTFTMNVKNAAGTLSSIAYEPTANAAPVYIGTLAAYLTAGNTQSLQVAIYSDAFTVVTNGWITRMFAVRLW